MPENKRSLRERRKQQHADRVRARRLRWGAAIAAVILVVSALFAFSAARNGGETTDTAGAPAANRLGPADAPVRVVEFGDFGCPSCRAWHNSGIKDRLRAEFGEQISFTFRHLPVITAQSPKAAEAAQCAAEQDAFWEYHDYLYEQAAPGQLAPAQLKQYAAAVGLDSQSFDRCLDSGRYEEYVQEEMQTALDMGARGTPSFFVNGEPANLFSYGAAVAAVRQHLP